MMALDICAAGCVTPIGASLAETAASARARLANLRDGPWHNRQGEPHVVGRVPDGVLPALADALQAAPISRREVQLLRMGHAALAEVLETLPDGVEVPLLLGLPEHHAMRPLDPAGFMQRLVRQSGAPIDLARSVAVPRGRAAGLMALCQAGERIASGATGFVLVGGVDSFIEPWLLDTLESAGRVRSSVNGDGFSPAEGAAFLLLGDPARRAAPPLAVLAGCAIGHEPGHLQSDAPYLGEGLAGAVGRLLAEAPPAAPIACTYASFNGERYWAREFGVARVRNAGHFAQAMQMEHPAECCGDLGAAHGPLLACLAAHGLAGGYRPGPCLVYASSDGGDRAAALLEAPR